MNDLVLGGICTLYGFIMQYLSEEHLYIFVLQILLLLGLSRGLGIVFSRFGQPAITAEILVGVLLGPTILGRSLPWLHEILFPNDPTQHAMLEAIAWLGILFFLLVSGLETDLSSAWRQKKDALLISLSDLLLPIIIAFVPLLLLSERYLVHSDQRIIFALFVATILTISALPVTARVLQDLNIYKTDVGLLIICALTINDVTGWVVFALILGTTTDKGMTPGEIVMVLFSTLLFAGFFLTIGRKLTHHAIELMHRLKLPEPGSSLSFISFLGLLGGAITLKIGIHALFGFFIAGIMAGDSKALSENTRHVIAQMVRAVLVPLFFATIGLKIDFIAGFDLFIVVFLLIIGIIGRYVGAWVGVCLTQQSREHRSLISIAHVPGGEMQIVVGMVALEYNVITETVFVAIIFGAVFSSIILAPWMKWSLNKAKKDNVFRFFNRKGLLPSINVQTRDEAIIKLCQAAAQLTSTVSEKTIVSAVLDRERDMGTALEAGIAVPHARLENLNQPIIIVGRSQSGLDWNAADGKPAELLFLILTPIGEVDDQVRILRAIAMAMGNPANREALRQAEHIEGMWTVLNTIITED